MHVLVGTDGSGKSYSYKGQHRYLAFDKAQLEEIVENCVYDDYLVDVWFEPNPKTLLQYESTDITFELHIDPTKISSLTGISPKVFYPPTIEEKEEYLSQFVTADKAKEIAPLLLNWYDIRKYVVDDIIPPPKREIQTDEYGISRLGWRYATWKGRRIMGLLLDKQ